MPHWLKKLVCAIERRLSSVAPSEQSPRENPCNEKPSDKWRQGDILPDSLARLILGRLAEDIHCSPLRVFREPGILVLLSQDCDLVQPSWQKEPFAEAIWGFVSNGADKPEDNSTRATAIPHDGDHYVFENRNRVTFPRHWLSGYEPTGNRVDSQELRQLIRMVLRRYDRQSLPTEFNNRLKKARVETKIRQLLVKKQRELSGVAIYLRLNTWHEPTQDDPIANYLVYPVAVARRDVYDSQRDALSTLMHGVKELYESDGKQKPKQMSEGEWLGIVGLLELCKDQGILVLDSCKLPAPFSQCDYVLSEALFTLDHLAQFKAWDFDYLSPDEDDTTPIPAHGRP